MTPDNLSEVPCAHDESSESDYLKSGLGIEGTVGRYIPSGWLLLGKLPHLRVCLSDLYGVRGVLFQVGAAGGETTARVLVNVRIAPWCIVACCYVMICRTASRVNRWLRPLERVIKGEDKDVRDGAGWNTLVSIKIPAYEEE